MIRLCKENDRGMIYRFLNEKPVYHTFLLSDIEQYGFEEKFQKVYVQEENSMCQGVYMTYFNNLILSGIAEKIDYKQVAELVTEDINTIMGDAEIICRLTPCIKQNYKLVLNNMYTFKQEPLEENQDIQYATLNDVDRIYEFLMSFPEIRNLYSEKGMLINRLKNNEGVHVFLEKDGAIIAHGNSAAKAEKTCMIGGICVAEKYRGRGYAKIILNELCRHICKEQRIPCIFGGEKPEFSIFKETGFEKYGQWGVVQIRRQS